MIPSILDDKRLEEYVRRENRAVRIKRYVFGLVGLAALSGLGVAVYHIYHALSR